MKYEVLAHNHDGDVIETIGVCKTLDLALDLVKRLTARMVDVRVREELFTYSVAARTDLVLPGFE